MSKNYHMGFDGFIWFIGVVEDRNDPSQMGRVKVRCASFHTENKNDLLTDDLLTTTMLPTTVFCQFLIRSQSFFSSKEHGYLDFLRCQY